MYSSVCNTVYKGRAYALQGYYEEKYYSMVIEYFVLNSVFVL